jgi:hypothetical protein
VKVVVFPNPLFLRTPLDVLGAALRQVRIRKHLGRTAPFDSVLLGALGFSLRDPRVREGNLRCVAIGPTQQVVGIVVLGVDLDEAGSRSLSCQPVEDFLSVSDPTEDESGERDSADASLPVWRFG